MVPPATERRNKSSDPGPVPNVLRIKPSPFTAPDSGKVVIYPSSSGVQRTLGKSLSSKALSECKLERLLAYGYVDCSSHHANIFDCFMNSISFASILKACCL
ncbi:hypothetical protein Bca4012_078476 [Brassica carinata]